MINAYLLSQWDRCRRKGVWDEDWESTRISPMGLVYRAMHAHLTAPEPVLGAVYDAVIRLAGERGVLVDMENPYSLAVHYGRMAEVIARAIRQPTVGPLRRFGVLDNRAHGWEYDVTSYEDGARVRLIRYVLVDHWDEDRAMSELHSWPVIGDICVSGLPMTLRVIVVGHSRNGRRHGHWTRCSQHPSNRQIRFMRKGGASAREEGFATTWRKVFREDTNIGVDAWLGQMARDGVLGESVKEIKVRVPDKLQRDRVLSDIQLISRELEKGQNMLKHRLELFPMNRSACDMIGRGPCHYQNCCLGMTDMTPGETGMFRKRVGDTTPPQA